MRERIIADLLGQYAQERARAEADAAILRAAVVSKAPLYANLGGELARVMGECAQTGGDAERKVMELRDRAEAQLRAAGYVPEDLAPKYTCAQCRDTGYVGEPVRSFCSCFERRFRAEVIAHSGLASSPGHAFDHFDLSVFPEDAQGKSQRETMRRVHAYAVKWAEDFPNNPRRDIVICGNTGLGKTFLLDCIAARVIQRGRPVLRLTAFRMIEAMRARHFGRDDGELMDMLLTVDLLFLDDLGTEPLLENITLEYLFAVLNERQQAGLSTMVATNLTPGELRARYSERVTSRLINSESSAVFLLEGRDVREGRRRS